MALAAQIVGFAALAACVTSYQFKTYRMILLFQVMTTALFMAQTPSAWPAISFIT